MDDLSQSFLGYSGIVYIVLNLICIAAAWWALQAVRVDVLLFRPNGARAKALLIMVSIVLGHGLAGFLIQYMGWTSLLKWMF
ncbi:DUF1146 family protein [Paenibacillus turpanensis]|uniref:DUF1146 family protein n=1 Tax=Paenibacillus turpanensis TaxID=2689078 RepID=UPI00140ACC58|nr:DUF1146 family protein [Paenibacillus turpanensis]